MIRFDDVYRNRRVLVTGHTGFKGVGYRFGFQSSVRKFMGTRLHRKPPPIISIY